MADPRLADALARLPDYLGGHVKVSLTALALGLVVSLPLAVVARRRPLLRNGALAAASVIQTIPGLALLTLFYPLLLALAAVSERITGFTFSALGFWPAVLALALYAMLPAMRNTIAGLDGVDPALHDAARALALTPRQTFRHIELPLAMPVIMAGIRTAAVWVIGAATLSTPIGQTSLGDYIFSGLQTQNWVFVLFGCIASAALAIAVDQLLALVERGFVAHSRPRLLVGVGGLALIAVGALNLSAGAGRGGYVVGAKPFAEQYVLAALIEQRLDAAGATASRRAGLGSSVAFDALAANDIDVYVDYSGTLWANRMRRREVKPREQVLADLRVWLKDTRGITLVGPLGFENAYALAMPRKRAQALGISSIVDLARVLPGASVAGDYEFFVRPEWAALRDAYGLGGVRQREMQAEFMYPALADDQIDVIAAYSSDGRIARHDLVLLDDPKRTLPPYDAVLLVSPARAGDARLLAALNPLVGAIDVETMRAANLRIDSGGPEGSPESVARWLWDRIGAKR